jgi:hypothetical protein
VEHGSQLIGRWSAVKGVLGAVLGDRVAQLRGGRRRSGIALRPAPSPGAALTAVP